jgi:hypothetical protein
MGNKKMNIKLILMFLSVLLLIQSCASVEYTAEERKCSGLAFVKFPVKMVQQTCNGLKPIRVADGSTCTTYGNYGYRTTTCTPKYKTNYIPYTYTCNVDVNKSSRNSFTNQCTKSNCMQIYGNPGCKVKSQAETVSVK